MARFSKRQIHALGERLRVANEPNSSDLEMLSAWRDEHSAALQGLRERIIAEGLGTPTPRIKTVQTIVEKLKRERTLELGTMRDVGGLRIVEDVSLYRQIEIREAVVALVPNARAIDRCAEPSYGYRAQHIAAKIDGCRIEIQVRTLMQHAWADLYERLGDKFGRGIRYGHPPRLTPNTPATQAAGQQIVDIVQGLAKVIADAEEKDGNFRKLTGVSPDEWSSRRLQATEEDVAKFADSIIRVKNEARRMIETLAAMVGQFK